jgi:hypothetical protein
MRAPDDPRDRFEDREKVTDFMAPQIHAIQRLNFHKLSNADSYGKSPGGLLNLRLTLSRLHWIF